MREKETTLRLAEAVAERGGTAYYAGGYVRDRLLGRENKDIDIEVHGIAPRELEALLDSLGERIAIGESFGIYALKGVELDIAMPRREENRGRGHKDFDVCVDPFIGTEKAAERRDFTVNAMMENVITGELIDHFGGREDLERGILRHVSDATFAEDPLRALRAAQFAARFGFTVAEETVSLCRSMDLSALPKERVMGELEKALLKAEHPSVFFETLRRMGQLRVWFPELEALIGVPQSPVHHAEGDVWVHTMLVTDAAVLRRGAVENPLGFMLAALIHDLGKAVCTEGEGEHIHAYDHEHLGVPLGEALLRRLTGEKALICYALSLSKNHMRPNIMAAANSSVKSTNHLFDEVSDPEALIALALSDILGMLPREDCAPREAFLRERLEKYRETMAKPFVAGKDLTAAGLPPSRRFGEYLALAHKLRLAGTDKEQALRQVLSAARKNGDVPGEKHG